mgnify:CR=1 FL=1
MVYKVLVADDEQVLRSLAVAYLELLTSEGYDIQTLEAKDGIEALRIISEQAGQGHGLDLVVSDVNMPGKTGIDVLVQGKQISPNTGFVIWSGRIQAYEDEVKQHGGTPLGKPVRIETFLQAVKTYLKPSSGA